MNKLLIPSSPNWYGSSTFVCSSDGTLVYCARNTLVVIKPSPDNSPADVTILTYGKKDKITVIAVNPTWAPSQKFIASTSEDKFVRLWDAEEKRVKFAHDGHSNNKTNLIGVAFLDNNRVASVSEDGFTVVWKLANNDLSSFQINIGPKCLITCISACPHLPGLVALGLNKGNVLVADLRKNGKVLSVLKKHNREVTSLSWSPEFTQGEEHINIDSNEENAVSTSKNVEGEKKRNAAIKTFYLATAMRGAGSIVIWKINENSAIIAELSLPTYTKYFNKDCWISLCWIKSNFILSSSSIGHILQWNFNPLDCKRKHKPIIVHTLHNKHVFGITSDATYLRMEDTNWRKEHLTAWSMGHEQLIVRVDVNTKEIVSLYPCVSGYIYCFAPSPLDPSRIAVGIGDSSLRIWNLTKSHAQRIEMTRLQYKQHLKITSLAWHPTNEDLIAFATLEGQVGYVNPTDPKSWKLFPTAFKGAAYKVEWGPINGDTSKSGLYAVGDGKIYIYPNVKDTQEVVRFQKLDSDYITQFAWKPDDSVLAVGTKLGYVTLFDSNFKQKVSLYHQQKAVQCIAWHPEATNEDTSISPYCNFLAVATNDTSILIYECMTEGDTNEKVIAVLDKHTKALKSLAWNTHKGAQLASCGEDGAVHLWDVLTKTVIASWYSQNCDIILSVLWSPIDPDFILCGGRDICLNIWKISENPPRLKPDVKSSEKEKVLKLPVEKKKEEVQSAPKEVKSTKTSVRSLLLNELSKCQSGEATTMLNDCRLLLKIHQTSNNSDVENDVRDARENTEKASACQLFGSREDVMRLLHIEKSTHMEKNRNFCAQNISLWNGQLGDEIKNAMANGTLSPWLISLAPMVSPKLWQEACEAYAKTQSESSDGDPFYTASYYLVCHKIEEAVRTLMKASCYREALALVKCRLGENDPFVREIIEAWAQYSMRIGNFEIAAQCFIALGQLEEAAKAIFRRSDVKSLEFCAEIAKACDKKDLLDAVLFRLNAFKQLEVLECKAELPTKAEAIISKEKDKEIESDNDKTNMEPLESIGENCPAKEIINEEVTEGTTTDLVLESNINSSITD